MHCYYKAMESKERGYLKRMINEWNSRGNYEFTQQRLADQKQQILEYRLESRAIFVITQKPFTLL